LANIHEEFENLIQQLARQRDELQVKMALAKLEAREEWANLENRWEHLKTNSSQIRQEVGATTENVGATLRKTAEEIRDGYERLRKLL
jgi:hypothetical protein